MELTIRSYGDGDDAALIALWQAAGLTRPWNDPQLDIDRKRSVQQELLLVAEIAGEIVGSAMAGYDGHRGAVYYVGVRPEHQRRGIARLLMREVELRLTALGCPNINLLVRETNVQALGFYHRIGYVRDPVIVASKRLIEDGVARPAEAEGRLQ